MGQIQFTEHKPAYFTVSDRGFLPRTLSMCSSLRSFDSSSPVYYFSTEPLLPGEYAAFESINVIVLSIDTFLESKIIDDLYKTRSHLEFMWTLPSQLLVKMWRIESSCSDFVYLDADIYFFSDPNSIWQEVPMNSVSIIRHNFSERLEKTFQSSGEFNVSWVSVPNSGVGMTVASKWSLDCLEMCPEKPMMHNGKLIYGDQKYLDYWPEDYGTNLHVIRHEGAGVAPWNYEKYTFSKELPLLIDGIPIIFFHFSSHQFGFFLAKKMGVEYSRVRQIPKLVYSIYEKALLENSKKLDMHKWKSRYKPLWKRVVARIEREFKN